MDVVLEMSDAPSAITDAFRTVRNGGRMTLFGIPSRPVEIDITENMIFKNLTVFALNGRRIWDTWYKTRWLLESGMVDIRPLITGQMRFQKVRGRHPVAGRRAGLQGCPQTERILLAASPEEAGRDRGCEGQETSLPLSRGVFCLHRA